MRTLTASGWRFLPNRAEFDEWGKAELGEIYSRTAQMDWSPPSQLVWLTSYRLRDGKRYVDTDGTIAEETHLRYVSTPVPIP
jgi:hypothetical protein